MQDEAPCHAKISPRNRIPRVLLRRLVALLAIGLVHMLLWPGEILTKYAIVGLLVLLPSSWLPRWAVIGLAAALIPVSLISEGGPLLIAGLFLLGSALVRYEVVEKIDRSTRGPLLLGLGFAAAVAGALWIQATGADTPQPSFASGLADLLFIGVYVCALLVLLRTPLRPVLQALFAPLGRMALTNYLTATLLVLAASPRRRRSWPREPSSAPSGFCPPSGCAATARGPSSGSGAGRPGQTARPSTEPRSRPAEGQDASAVRRPHRLRMETVSYERPWVSHFPRLKCLIGSRPSVIQVGAHESRRPRREFLTAQGR